MTLAEVAAAVDGRLGRGADPVAVVRAVTIDSRAVGAGTLFVALRGERVDGHDFASAAVAAGAPAVLAARPLDVPAVLVADVVAALGRLANAALLRLSDVTVVAVTGSSGKTGTKDLLAGVLDRRGATVAPVESFNNEIGHPLTVLRADAGTRYLVLECSARGAGHIAYLCGVARPRVAVVLNVGVAHLGEFGSREAIAAAKGELVEALPSDGVAVLNADDPLVEAMAGRTSARVVRFGLTPRADVRAEDLSMAGGRASFTLVAAGGRAGVRLRLYGEHQASNALAAAAVALELGMPLDDVAAALSDAEPRSRWRMEVTETGAGVTVVNDAYNANPESMRAALEALVSLAGSRRSWAVLGEMGELGDDAAAAHDAVGRLAVRLGVSRLVVVGDAARPLHTGAVLEGSWSGESVHVPDVDAAVTLLRGQLRPGDVVLVKASRAAGLERVAAALTGGEGPSA